MLATLQKRLKLLAGDPATVLAAADTARDQRSFEAAARLYRRYLSRRSTDGPIWVQYGHALKETGDLQAASDAYQRANGLMPNDPDLHLQIGHLNKISGNAAAAIASYRRALELHPGFTPAQDELDRMQSVTEVQLTKDWRVAVDRFIRDTNMRIAALEHRISELEQSQTEARSPLSA